MYYRTLAAITIVLTALWLSGAEAVAHPGHGVSDPGTFWHGIVDHGHVIAVAAAAAVILHSVLRRWRIRRS